MRILLFILVLIYWGCVNPILNNNVSPLQKSPTSSQTLDSLEILNQIIHHKSISEGYTLTSDNEKIYTKYDEFDRKTLYKHRTFVSETNRIPISLYGSKLNSDSVSSSIIRICYLGNDWIFYDSVILLNENNERLEYSINSTDKFTEVDSYGRVWEIYHHLLSVDETKNFFQFIIQKPIRLRLDGKYQKDYVLDENRTESIIEMMKYLHNF